MALKKGQSPNRSGVDIGCTPQWRIESIPGECFG